MRTYSEGKLLWDYVRVANNPISRFKGLMGRKELLEGEGLLLIPCNQVHTFNMRIPLDILYLSPDKRILKVVTLKPGKVGPKVAGAESVLEVEAGTVQELQITTGDRIAFV